MIRVNNATYNAVVISATNGSMTIEFTTNDSVQSIEEVFIGTPRIEVIENGEITAIYYNREVKSLKITPGSPRKIEVLLSVSAIEESVEAELNERSGITEDAIVELAELISVVNERILALEDIVLPQGDN